MNGMLEGVSLADRLLPTTLPPNHNLGDGLMIMAWAVFTLSTVLIAARMVSKIMISRRFRMDDVFLLLTWVGAAAYPAMMQLAHQNGFGQHSFFLNVPATIRLLKWIYVGMHFAIITSMLGRIAVGLYTLSLLGVNAHWVRYTFWFLIFQQLVHNVGISITLPCACGIDIVQIAK